MNFGMRVRIEFSEGSGLGKGIALRNVTEIHFNYPSPFGEVKIAFESDIHKTGLTYRIGQIDEFETNLETKKAKSF